MYTVSRTGKKGEDLKSGRTTGKSRGERRVIFSSSGAIALAPWPAPTLHTLGVRNLKIPAVRTAEEEASEVEICEE